MGRGYFQADEVVRRIAWPGDRESKALAQERARKTTDEKAAVVADLQACNKASVEASDVPKQFQNSWGQDIRICRTCSGGKDKDEAEGWYCPICD